MTFARVLICVIHAIAGVSVGGDRALAETATFMLPKAAVTSAAVIDADDRLVRTLWSAERHAAGSLRATWDGRDDDGNLASAAAPYRVRLLAHNVSYVWEGVIGNTSLERSGRQIHRAFEPVHDMAIDTQGNAFYVVGYNEQQPGLHRFAIKEPQRRTSFPRDDYQRVFRYVATDGERVYIANTGTAFDRQSFILALSNRDWSEHRFRDGAPVGTKGPPGNRWASAIDPESLGDRIPSGLAVQRDGSDLFVARRGAGEIRVFDKITGAPKQSIVLPAAADLDVAPDGSLWALSRSRSAPVLVNFRLHDGRWEAAATIGEGLLDPVAVSVSPRDGAVLVADAGTEQVKAFAPDGSILWTLGEEGGQRNGPEVKNDRFWLSAGPAYLAHAPDGSFWFGDPGNARNLHFSGEREYLDQIAYLPKTYIATVDVNDPRRVFAHFLEFEVDYDKPVQDSWRLVRNWGASAGSQFEGHFGGLRAVFTLSNQRTYAVAGRTNGPAEIVELGAGIRPTGKRLETGTRLQADGSLQSHVLRGLTLQVYRQTLSGFDAQGNPQWNAPELLSRVSRLAPGDPYYRDVPVVAPVNEVNYPQTRGGLVISFNPGRAAGFHLGALRPDDDRWVWRTSPAGSWQIDRDGQVIAPRGVFETERGVQYAGNTVMTAGEHIVFGYHGEAWNGGQANQWLHFHESGLFIGQFGRPVYVARNRLDALPESAGNAFTPTLVEVGGQLYLWHNDESVHGGLHRWRIEGAREMQLLYAPMSPHD